MLDELAQVGRIVLGLDVRDYDEDGTFREVAWNVYEGADPNEAHHVALQAVTRERLPGKLFWSPRVPDRLHQARSARGPGDSVLAHCGLVIVRSVRSLLNDMYLSFSSMD